MPAGDETIAVPEALLVQLFLVAKLEAARVRDRGKPAHLHEAIANQTERLLRAAAVLP